MHVATTEEDFTTEVAEVHRERKEERFRATNNYVLNTPPPPCFLKVIDFAGG
jgi:hypothetical protein